MPELLSNELEYLQQHFRVTTLQSGDWPASCSVKDLLEPDSCEAYLTHLSDLLDSPSLVVTASQFSKWYTFMAVLPALYAMSAFNKGLDVSIENCHIESGYQNNNWTPRLKLDNWSAFRPEGDRNDWRERMVRAVFAENIAKVWRALSACTGISRMLLWENTAVYVYWLYEKKLAEADERTRRRAQEDFRYLISGAPPECFGDWIQPLSKYYFEKMPQPGSEEPIRMRKTCCLYYQLAGAGEYCSNCPKKMQEVSCSLPSLLVK
ncbi:IucA/IucC family C-terminal-domain containing protein [Lihuaxuella thermophila]|uniref:Siderophore-iron reductase FhuF n=1 Tax=Lihuaxuella thermophila TaxID=1173111 RepID=A0A1H8E731_9BACL|nr:IucA/IucC family C-terminal-domain containing protein [Lihuaxuella thermophila]SEN15305.1 siderophore-iron reductase FhuF [Lihuaxuella thermophila]